MVDLLHQDQQGSLEALRRGAEVANDREDWPAKARIAIVAWRLGDVSVAQEMLRAFPKSQPAPWRPPDLAGQFQQQLDKHSEQRMKQLHDSQQMNQRGGVDVASYYCRKRAEANFHLGRPVEALADFERLSPQSLTRLDLAMMAVCLAETNQVEKARETAKAAAEDSLWWISDYVKILVEAALGNVDEAARLLDRRIAEARGRAEAQGKSVELYRAACVAAQLARLAPDEESQYIGRSLELLRRAHDYRFCDWFGFDLLACDLQTDAYLLPLHKDSAFQELVNEFFPPTQTWDPVQRTRFIEEFGQWSGDLASLVQVELPDDAELRSGVCLALGGVDSPSDAERDAWRRSWSVGASMPPTAERTPRRGGCFGNGRSPRQSLPPRLFPLPGATGGKSKRA